MPNDHFNQFDIIRVTEPFNLGGATNNTKLNPGTLLEIQRIDEDGDLLVNTYPVFQWYKHSWVLKDSFNFIEIFQSQSEQHTQSEIEESHPYFEEPQELILDIHESELLHHACKKSKLTNQQRMKGLNQQGNPALHGDFTPLQGRFRNYKSELIVVMDDVCTIHTSSDQLEYRILDYNDHYNVNGK